MPKTVLIVEDDDLNLRFFRTLLEWQGYRTQIARTGACALETARAERPDLILLDIELPDDSGYAVAGALREQRRDGAAAPVIAVTAHAGVGVEARARAAGCAGYVSKPVSMHGFLDVVRKFAQD